ncbi:enoyl-CoA hydratase-related protein [Caballeronia sp. AZ7_KS35]|uniref:enoyl-CoA hydratase/isomerase family protein n=1 Tax=Caballeronia sp. AZ7_KS35 TaxID=2921762 RepID=UPI002028D0F9|nr:enoyl-CoA hydratase-related protein [Caballeronia sp. AZ7_KS35]
MPDILFDKRDGGAFVTLNRPEVRNALTPEMLLETANFIAAIEHDPEVRYLVFQGAGDHFAAGGDVDSYRRLLDMPATARQRYFERRVRANAETFVRLQSLPIPVVTLVRGAAAGAGLSFVLASDFVLAAQDALLIFAQPRIGLPVDLGASWFLPRIVGAKKARQLAFTGARLNAQDALDMGIVDAIHERDQLDEALAGLVREFGSVAPRAAGRSKTLINASEGNGIVEQMEHEVRAISACIDEPDFAEGVTAFVEKRKAVFRGAGPVNAQALRVDHPSAWRNE